MERARRLTATLSFVLGAEACSVPTTTDEPAGLAATSDLGQPCRFGYPVRTGAPVTVTFRAEVTRCHCEFITKTLGIPSCESTSDVGNENPEVCDEVPVDIDDIDVHSGRGDCATSIARDPEDSTVARLGLRCPIDGVAGFTLHAQVGGRETSSTIFFELTSSGRCP